MNQLDVLYRAFLDFRKSTVEDESCKKLRLATARASADKDKVESQRSVCTIEEDWVRAIEKGLPFVEKAIREERQFIRQQGEVVPIEKARRVSKASVSHLARHGNLITRAPEKGKDLIPDEIYMVERLSDYAVYENRFLYMLLCFLRDFIDLRYTKIVELGNTYKASMTMAKTVVLGKRTITYHTQFTEEARNDPYSFLDQNTASVMTRIEDLQKIVSSLLATPLMREVSHAPMLKPPITRTNALKMDNALRQSLALYDYVAAYKKDGYTVETLRKTFNPLPDNMGDEFAETVALTSFLVYEYSNDLKERLKASYDEEELRRKAEKAEQLRRRIQDLQGRISEAGMSPEEYMLLLEERNAYLERLKTQLDEARAAIAARDERIEALLTEQERLLDVIADLEHQIRIRDEELEALELRRVTELREQALRHQLELTSLRAHFTQQILSLRRFYEEELAAQKAQYEAALAEQKTHYESALAEQKNQYETELAQQKTHYETELTAQKTHYEAALETQKTEYESRLTAQETEFTEALTRTEETYREELEASESRRVSELAEMTARTNEQYRQTVASYESTLAETRSQNEQTVTALEESLSATADELTRLKEAYTLLKAEHHAVKQIRGTEDTEDFTSEERFNELVEELAALDAYVGRHWKKAKRHIRNRYLWNKENP